MSRAHWTCEEPRPDPPWLQSALLLGRATKEARVGKRAFPDPAAWAGPLRLRQRLTGSSPEPGQNSDKTRHVFDTLGFDPFELDLGARALALQSGQPTALATSPRSRSRRRALREGGVFLVSDMVACLLTIGVLEMTLLRFKSVDLGIVAMVVPATIGWALLANIYGLYDRDRVRFGRSVVDDLPDLLILSSLATWFGLLLLNASDVAHPKLRNAAAFWLVYLVLLTTGRTLVRWLLSAQTGFRQPALVVGAGQVGRMIAAKIASRSEYGLDVLGYLDDDPVETGADDVRLLGRLVDAERVIGAYGIERVIVAFSQTSALGELDLCRRCLALGVKVDIVPRLYEVIGWRNYVRSLDGIPLIGLHTPSLSPLSQLLKRTLDLVLASIGLLALSPLFLYCAVRIKLGPPGPVFFSQERIGSGGQRFRILKFRTMMIDADSRKDEVAHLNKHIESGPRMFKVPGDPRITPFGRFMRRWSIDELPQLVNVVRGEMSLVGPRPLILDEDENVLGQHRKRLDLTPGITGLWQVLGRSEIAFSEMVALDYLYVTNWSLWGDVKLLARTVPVVLQKRGAY